jgi:hypothetical protein
MKKRILTLGKVKPATKRSYQKNKLKINDRTTLQMFVRATAEIMGSEKVMENRKELGEIIHQMVTRQKQLDYLKVDYKVDPELERLERKYADILGTVDIIRFKVAFNRAIKELN